MIPLESIDTTIAIIAVAFYLLGAVTTWYWKSRKFKEYKETQDAETEYWKKKDDFKCQLEIMSNKEKCSHQCFDCEKYEKL